MSKIDRIKEEIGWLKVAFGVAAALGASVIAWLAQNVTTQVGGVNLPPLQGEGWGGDGVLRGILPPIPLPASPLKGEEICVPT
ncbi:MAG: hypothetical protein Q8O31_08660, partial [Rhodocyclaceae bacterium]|nr:hypothetical protein [Rhodocyclaceae bacterium]